MVDAKFRPGDKVICRRYYEKEKVYRDYYKRDPSSCPKGGKKYLISEVGIDYKGRIWLGLVGIGRGILGWSAESFEKFVPLSKKKKEGRLIRL